MFTFTSSQAFAFSEEDMLDGITLSIEKNQKSEKSYKYDNTMVNAKGPMTEFDFFPESLTNVRKYKGDSTCPEAGHIMADVLLLLELEFSSV